MPGKENKTVNIKILLYIVQLHLENWLPHLRRVIVLLGKVQERATNRIKGVEQRQGKVAALGPFWFKERVRSDMIDAWHGERGERGRSRKTKESIHPVHR